jgi:hypothetical protein
MSFYGWYRTEQWRKFRDTVFELDGYKCVDCNRIQSDGVTLQVHHKRYIRGLKPWDYAPEDCETLCRRCHAEKHGLVFPKFGWTCCGEEDLGELSGECERCGTQLRYVFTVTHDDWFDMEVGTDCCDDMTGTQVASEWRKLHERKKRFLKSRKWERTSTGSAIKLEKTIVRIESDGIEFRISVDQFAGSKSFKTATEALLHLFEIYNDGKLKEFVIRRKLKKND